MFKAIKEFFVGKPAEVVVPSNTDGAMADWHAAPYKIDPVVSVEDKTAVSRETPVDIQNEQRHDDVLTVVTAEVTIAPMPVVVATVIAEAPAKAARKPRAPKVVAEKSAAKKAAPVKKAATKVKLKKA